MTKMKACKKMIWGLIALLLLLPIMGCKKKVIEPTFEISDNIILTTNQNIDWSEYIEVKVDDTLIDLSEVTIVLLTGDDTKDGTCTYEISYQLNDQIYKQTFEVTFQYKIIELLEPEFTIKKDIVLDSDQQIDWNQYITITFGGKPVSLSEAQIKLISGDSSEDGVCTYEVSYKINDQTYKQTFEVTFQHEKKPIEPVFTIKKDIVLDSNQQIDWNQYITITLDGEPININDAQIKLISGDPSKDGVCTYELSYLSKKESFEVTYNYSAQTSLTAKQRIQWQKACGMDYQNMTVIDGILNQTFYCSESMIRCDYQTSNQEYSVYLKKTDTGYDIYKNNSWTKASQDEIDQYALSFDFKKIDVTKLSYDESLASFVYNSNDLSFCPMYQVIEGTFDHFIFCLDDAGYISYIGLHHEGTYEQLVLTSFGSTQPGTPSNPPVVDPDPSDFTLGDIQTMDLNSTVDVTGIVVGKTTKGILIKDVSVEEYVFVFKNSTVNASIYDIVAVSGTVSEFGGAKQISNPTIEVASQGETVDFNPTPFSGSDITAYANNVVVGVQASITGKLQISGNYYNFTVDGTSIVVSISYPTQSLTEYNNKEITIEGYLIYLSGSSKKYANIVLVNVVEGGVVTPPDTGDLTDLTEEQKTAWNQAVSQDYSNYTLNDSAQSNKQSVNQNLYYCTSFDESGYVSLDYYKKENTSLYTYTPSGWTLTTKNPLLTIEFQQLQNISLEYVKFNAATNQYSISTSNLSLANLIPGWKSYSATSIFIELETEGENSIIKTIGIITKTEIQAIYISNVGTTSFANPEESCNLISIIDIQDLATNSLCTVSGTVIELTKTGFLVGDNDNRLHAAVYVNLGKQPEVQIGDQVKIFGPAVKQEISLEFDSTAKIEKLEGSIDYEFNPDFLSMVDISEYVDDPKIGLHAEFVATYKGNNQLQVEYVDQTIQLIDPTLNLTNLINKQVLVQGYFLYTDYTELGTNNIFMVLKSMEECTSKNPYLIDLTDEQKNEITQAINFNYSANVLMIDGIYGSSTDIDSNGIITFTYTDPQTDQESSYQLKNENGSYQINEGSGWTAITEAEYLSSALFFQFNMLDVTKIKYNTKTGLYELSASDCDINQFAPLVSDEDTTYIGYNFVVVDGHFGAVQIVNYYDGYLYADTCAIYVKSE